MLVTTARTSAGSRRRRSSQAHWSSPSIVAPGSVFGMVTFGWAGSFFSGERKDSNLPAKLEAELVTLREKQTRMVAVNATLRKTAKAGREAQIEALAAIGWNLRPVDVIARGGFERFELSNSGANIRRIEKRIAELRAKAAAPARDPITGNGYAIVEDRDANRVQIRFDFRPPAATIAVLKSRGFRWAPSENAWQRQASNGAWHAAQSVAASLDAGEIVP